MTDFMKITGLNKKMKIPSTKNQISNKSQWPKFKIRNHAARPWVQHLKALRRPNEWSPIQTCPKLSSP